MSKHTPGPWEWTEYTTTIECRRLVGGSRGSEWRFVCYGGGGHGGAWAKDHADARLIAAAPDQNAALHQCADLLESAARAMEQIATMNDPALAMEWVRNSGPLRVGESVARAAIAKAEGS